MASSPVSGGGKDCILTFENFITGESNDADAKIKDGVDLIGFAWGATRGTDASSGQASGRRRYDDVHCTASVSKASPQIFQAFIQNMRIRSAILHVRKQGALDSSGKTQGVYYVVKLKDVAVTAFRSALESVADNPIPVDEFKLNFAEIEFTYFPQTEKGGLGGAVSANDSLRSAT